MYIVFEHADYEGSEVKSAHEDLEQAVKAAEAVVAERADAPSARRDVKDAPGVGPALCAIAYWRVYDYYDVVVCEVIMSPIL